MSRAARWRRRGPLGSSRCSGFSGCGTEAQGRGRPHLAGRLHPGPGRAAWVHPGGRRGPPGRGDCLCPRARGGLSVGTCAPLPVSDTIIVTPQVTRQDGRLVREMPWQCLDVHVGASRVVRGPTVDKASLGAGALEGSCHTGAGGRVGHSALTVWLV